MSLSELIKNRYGSKKGLLRYLAYEVLRILGFYRSLGKVDFAKVKRLVFICQGNICRSPLAEAIACHQRVVATSFGLNTRGGDSADMRAINWAQTNGYDLQSHITRCVDDYVPLAGDLLIGMEPKHISSLKAQFAHTPVQISLVGLWLKSPLAYLHDPYNTNSSYFDLCERRVEQAALEIVAKLLSIETRMMKNGS